MGLPLAYYLTEASVSQILVKQLAIEPQVVQAVSGLLGLFCLPLINAVLLIISDAWWQGQALSLSEALALSRKAWWRLMMGYITISFIFFGWLVVGVLPAFLLLQVLKIDNTAYLVLAGIPAVVVMARYGFMESLIVVRGLEPFFARQRSTELAAGRWPALLACGLLLLLPAQALELFGNELAAWLWPGAGVGAWVVALGVDAAASLLAVWNVVFFYHWFRSIEAES